MVRLVVASTNRGKLREIASFFADTEIEVVSVADVLGQPLLVDEVGETFEANAVLKAEAACQATQLLALADDSGLEVDALGGRPGVRSARYAGEQATDTDNNELLLRELTGVEPSQRTARFRCAMAVAQPGATTLTVAGSCEGVIGAAPRGAGGFGYDPLFVVPSLGGRTFAELTPGEKERLSHRGEALRKLRVLLLERLAGRAD